MTKERNIEKIHQSGRRKRSIRGEIYLLRENLRSEGKREKRRGGRSGDNILGRTRDSMKAEKRNMKKQSTENILKTEITGERKVRGTPGTNTRRVTMFVGMMVMRGEMRSLGIIV